MNAARITRQIHCFFFIIVFGLYGAKATYKCVVSKEDLALLGKAIWVALARPKYKKFQFTTRPQGGS